MENMRQTESGNRPHTKTRTRATRAKPAVRRYTEEQKIAAVTAILTAAPDMPTSSRAIEAAYATGVDVDVSTLRDWTMLYREEVTALIPIPKTTQEIVLETRQAV